jgi:hypothetical protein
MSELRTPILDKKISNSFFYHLGRNSRVYPTDRNSFSTSSSATTVQRNSFQVY